MTFHSNVMPKKFGRGKPKQEPMVLYFDEPMRRTSQFLIIRDDAYEVIEWSEDRRSAKVRAP